MRYYIDSWPSDETFPSDQPELENENDSRTQVIRPGSSLFRDALDYRTYRPASKDYSYNDTIAHRI